MKSKLPRVVVDHYHVKVYIGSLLHVKIVRQELVAVESWVDLHNADYVIEYTTKQGAKVKTQYDGRDKWEAVLKGLEEKW